MAKAGSPGENQGEKKEKENAKLGGFCGGNKGIFMGQLAPAAQPFAQDIRGPDEEGDKKKGVPLLSEGLGLRVEIL